MKISQRWYQKFLPSQYCLESNEVANLLTQRGIEVESIEPFPVTDKVVMGEIISFVPHPRNAALKVCELKLNKDDKQTVVCGADNIAVGMRVAVAKVGGKLNGRKVEACEIEGVLSSGIICSPQELNLNNDHSGILSFNPSDPITLGEDLNDILFLNDTLYEVKVTPNRGDCLSHLGIARELASVLECDLQSPAALPLLEEAEAISAVEVVLEAKQACPYYSGLVIQNVDCKQNSPWWLQTLIERCGGRCINIVVDITNYLMLAFGQPLHAFDLEKLTGKIRVRFSQNNETMVVLGGTKITCDEKTLLIADELGPVAMAGVMGGLESGVSDDTQHIFMEAAFFTPDAIRNQTRKYQLNSEAAFRFERGVDWQLPTIALSHAGQLLKNLCQGRCGKIFAEGHLPSPVKISLPSTKVKKLLGISLTQDEQKKLLSSLQLPVNESKDELIVTVPSWRFDLSIMEDLVEEVVRAWGYERLPETFPEKFSPITTTQSHPFALSTVRTFLSERGFFETINYSFVPPSWETQLSSVSSLILSNPMSEEISSMRTTLWGGLLDRALCNIRHQQSHFSLFEIGRCFFPSTTGNLPLQPVLLGGIMIGTRLPLQWGEKAHPLDFYDAKGLLQDLGAPHFEFEFCLPSNDNELSALHPGKSAQIIFEGEVVGAVGELSPSLLIARNFKKMPLLFSLNLERLQKSIVPFNLKNISHFPLIFRDLSLVIDAHYSVGELLSRARQEGKKMKEVQSVDLFDFLSGQGSGVEKNKKVCGLRITLQGEKENLTTDEIDKIEHCILDVLKSEFKVLLRKQYVNILKKGGEK